MPIVFTCACGEQLTVDEEQQGRQALCLKCRSLVRIPSASVPLPAPGSPVPAPGAEAAKPEAPPASPKIETEVLPPLHVERLADQWKLKCHCGKRLLVPLCPAQPSGRCPKCGRRLQLPGFHAAGFSAPTPGAESPKAEMPDASPSDPKPPSTTPPAPEEEAATIIMDPVQAVVESGGAAVVAGREAARHAADLLRAHRVSATAERRVSAWPLAGRLPRALAGFVDFTASALAAAVVVTLGSLRLLPESFTHPLVALAAFFCAGLLNDCLFEPLGGGAGKRLVILTLRKSDGRPPETFRLLIRGGLKWLLIPGWLTFLFDPAERAVHDWLCGTLVLKGHPHSRAA